MRRANGRAAAEPLERRRLLSGYAYQTIGLDESGNGFAVPAAPPVADATGAVYETVGTGNGLVLRVATATGVATTAAPFTADTGTGPVGRLAVDPAGDVFGTTAAGGPGGTTAGTIWDLPAGASQITVLATLASGGLADPTDGLVRDAAGNLYGTADVGGTLGGGAAFELPAGATEPVTLASFPPGKATGSTVGGAAVDAAGDLFGYTSTGGRGHGTLWEVAAGSTVARTLYTAGPAGAGDFQGPLATDGAGNVYALADLAPARRTPSTRPAAVLELGRRRLTPRVVARFASGTADVRGGVTVDPAGDAFGTGGDNGRGTVFEVRHGARRATTLYRFGLYEGPVGVSRDAAGRLYGAVGPADVVELSPGGPNPAQSLDVAVAAATVDVADAVPSVAGQAATAVVTIANGGAARRTGTLGLSLGIGSVPSRSTPVDAPTVGSVAVDLMPGGSTTVTVGFDIPLGLSSGDYTLSATLTPVAGFATGHVSEVPFTTTTPVPVAPAFGNIPGRGNLPLTVTAAGGATVTYALTGPGVGTVYATYAGGPAATLTGTTAATVLTVSSSVPLTPIGPLTLDSPMGTVDASAVSATSIYAGDVSRIVTGALGVEGVGAAVRIGGNTPVSLSLGAVTDAVVSAVGPIASLAVASWAGPAAGETPIPGSPGGFSIEGDITAAAIGDFADAGSFSGQVLSATTIGTFAVGGNLAGTVLAGAASAGGGPIGSSPGGTGVDGRPTDTFGVGTIAGLAVGGSVAAGTLVAAGLSVPGDRFPVTAATASLLPGGAIGPVTVRGTIGAGAAIVAASLPAEATVGGVRIATASATAFALPTSCADPRPASGMSEVPLV